MSAMRPSELIDHELRAAENLAQHFSEHPSDDPLVAIMREQNTERLERLQGEQALAHAGALEVSLDGEVIKGHDVPLPFLARVVGGLQSAFRAHVKVFAPEGSPITKIGTLNLSATGPGSFRMALKGPVEPLELLDAPTSDRALGALMDLLSYASGQVGLHPGEWAQSAPEPAVRATIRLVATLAGSRGTTQVRWRPVDGNERIVVLTAEQARALATALAGPSGLEVVVVTGHLSMAQDAPPRIRVQTSDDSWVATIEDAELLEPVKDLLFTEVVATLGVEMKTSQTTGAPSTSNELLDLRPAG